MFVKKKHISVISWSTAVICVVFVSTLVVYNIYIHWKENVFYSTYRDTINSLTARMFTEEVFVERLRVSLRKEPGTDHAVAVLEGTLVNRSSKTLERALLEVNFEDHRGEVLYKVWVYMLGQAPVSGYGPIKVNEMVDVLEPGESFFFRHKISNCPEEIIRRLAREEGFARVRREEQIDIRYAIEELSVR